MFEIITLGYASGKKPELGSTVAFPLNRTVKAVSGIPYIVRFKMGYFHSQAGKYSFDQWGSWRHSTLQHPQDTRRTAKNYRPNHVSIRSPGHCIRIPMLVC